MARLLICLALLSLGAEAHRGHHHNHDEPADTMPSRHHVAAAHDSKLEGEAADMKAMMEGVKAQTDEQSGVKPAAPKEAAAPEEEDKVNVQDVLASTEDDHAKDEDILKEVAKMQNMMSGRKTEKKRSSLAHVAQKVSEKTQEDRAAEYFATHGMGKMGKMLGETLTTKDALKAATKMEAEMKFSNKDTSASSSSTTGSASLDDVDLGEDDDESATQKKRWAMVDELKMKKARFMGA